MLYPYKEEHELSLPLICDGTWCKICTDIPCIQNKTSRQPLFLRCRHMADRILLQCFLHVYRQHQSGVVILSFYIIFKCVCKHINAVRFMKQHCWFFYCIVILSVVLNLVSYGSSFRARYFNIKGRDVRRKYAVNNVDKSNLWAPWQNQVCLAY